MHSGIFLEPAFMSAVADYYYFLNRNYPEKGVLKMVGDRYQLSGELRTVLYRGISSRLKINERQTRLVSSVAGKEITIDGYNVLLTLLNYKLGRLVFISADSFVRDAGSLFGKIKDQKEFRKILTRMMELLAAEKPEYVRIFFDSPVSYSLEHKSLTLELMKENNLSGEVEVVHSADYELKRSALGILCTSDSAIIDNTANQVSDLGYLLIKSLYQPKLPDLRPVIQAIENGN